MRLFLWVCLGGGLGSGVRYLLSLGALRWLGAGFPYGTLAVNLIGSLLLAALFQYFHGTDAGAPGLRLALTTGAMGGFTTYSTFNLELMRMIERGVWGEVVLYVALTLCGCLIAGAVGMSLVRWAV